MPPFNSTKLPVASKSSKKSFSFSAALRQTPQADPNIVDLSGHQPPIDTLDAPLKDLKSIRRLSLSTNTISVIQNIPEKITILSLGRNAIKRLDGIQAASAHLEQLWISYNAIDSLKGIEAMHQLRVLYASNNMISSWEEIDRLKSLEHLTDVLFIGNPLHAKYHGGGPKNGNNADGPATYVREMRKRLKHLKKLDGKLLNTDDNAESESNEGVDREDQHACDATCCK